MTSAPPNPDFARYCQDAPLSSEQGSALGEYPLGMVPVPVDLSHTRGQRIVFGQRALLDLPISYDMRTANPGKLPAVRDQGGCGSCWNFAAYGSLESSLLPSSVYDFSENHMKNTHGFDFACCSGGNSFMATAYLARWSGPVLEASDPYNGGSCVSPVGLTPVRHVQHVAFVPERAGPLDNDNLKQAVMAYGAVFTSFYWTDACYNTGNKSYYCASTNTANHSVCIVGWDDSYDRARFSSTPPANGAFIMRNSWGSSWGEGGCFYVSYYDANVGRENAIFDNADALSNYNVVYQHDPYGWVASLGYGTNTAWCANVFTASSSGQLQAVSFYAAAPGASYEILVYLDSDSGPTSGSGPFAVTTGTVSDYGYETIALSTPVQLAMNHKFSVVVKLTTPGYSFPVPYERPYVGYCSAAASHSGESYISADGSAWSDITSVYANANVCIKAFTKESGGISVTPATAMTSDGPVGGPFSPTSQVYTVTNSSTGSLSWSASKNASWINLSSTGGTLASGASGTVVVSLNSNASTLPAGTATDSVTFSNLTDGIGSTSRTVSLVVFDNYQLKAAPISWVNPSSHTNLGLGDDSVSAVQPVPFAFTFYGKTYNKLYVGANGMVGLASENLTAYSNTNIPSISTPNAVMYPFWDDMDPSSGGSVRVGTSGTAPNRKMVVTWLAVPHLSASSYPFTFQAVLCEGSNDICFQYLNVQPAQTNYGGGRSATVGIENEKGTVATKYSYNGSTLLKNKQALLFTSRGPTPGDAKKSADGATVSMRRAIVTAVFGESFYVESDDRIAAIRADCPGHLLVPSMRADISGVLRTATSGERYIQAGSAVQSGWGTLSPMGVNVRGVGGAGYNYDAVTGTGQRGMTHGYGASNIGMLMRTAGRVTEIGSDFFRIDDGAQAATPYHEPMVLKVKPGAAPMPSLGAFVQVTGIVSCYSSGDDLYPLLLVSGPSEIVILQ